MIKWYYVCKNYYFDIYNKLISCSIFKESNNCCDLETILFLYLRIEKVKKLGVIALCLLATPLVVAGY